ncbi:hypothetical protein B0T26DRAFT_779636 [Lasiosphaeria miniovina]|uniref:Nucleoside phosphorylase domain-containing protein n=1 Tax=Lasiosphaeria miniovina TaxID=1954250 RepID=A0AA40AB34_9PEZI|nr:uncharacterized protein B0T26DRAFT_779636 [Lasiosphaeria miniovina]KAK0712465.1 hypothetical protein B0T26DRAFT_779636 [Lasiosphaeria miniovina]
MDLVNWERGGVLAKSILSQSTCDTAGIHFLTPSHGRVVEDLETARALRDVSIGVNRFRGKLLLPRPLPEILERNGRDGRPHWVYIGADVFDVAAHPFPVTYNGTSKAATSGYYVRHRMHVSDFFRHSPLPEATAEPDATHDAYSAAYSAASHEMVAGDDNTYVLGRIDQHNVVMACLPGQYGTNNAAIVATNLKRSFPNVRATLMVGIGGGAPSQADLYLGDVVVGTRIMQYDMGKMVAGGLFQETADIDARRTTIRAAHTKTCRWLLQHSKYRDWLDPGKQSQNHGFLWIRGKPGAGTSTMKFVYLETKKYSKKPKIAVASFFFNARGDYKERSISGMYRSLLLQLLYEFPDLQSVLDDTDIVPQNQQDCLA